MELSTPESLFPIEVAKNQPPIINEVRRAGLNLETKDKPIGLRNNSPIVITAYELMNHHAEDFSAPLLDAYTAPTMTKQESAEIKRPKAIFVGVEGSFPLRFKKAKKATTNGVSAMTQNGFTLWNKLVLNTRMVAPSFGKSFAAWLLK